MSNLTEFLLARIAEDEAAIAWTPVEIWPSRRRILAECEAKRRIVAECVEADEEGTSGGVVARRVLRLLALPYADHPDYRQEWRPRPARLT